MNDNYYCLLVAIDVGKGKRGLFLFFNPKDTLETGVSCCKVFCTSK